MTWRCHIVSLAEALLLDPISLPLRTAEDVAVVKEVLPERFWADLERNYTHVNDQVR